MYRSALPLVVAALLLVAGCTTGVPESPAESTPTATGEGTAEYFVRAGEIPEELESVTVTFQVVLVDNPVDLGPCYPKVFSGPYKPTITPLPTPSGDCHLSKPVSVDLTEINGTHSLDYFAVPSFVTGHALLVTNVTATYQNGTTTTAIKGTGGAELFTGSTRPSGPYGVEVSLSSARSEAGYDYWLVSERFEPAG